MFVLRCQLTNGKDIWYVLGYAESKFCWQPFLSRKFAWIAEEKMTDINEYFISEPYLTNKIAQCIGLKWLIQTR